MPDLLYKAKPAKLLKVLYAAPANTMGDPARDPVALMLRVAIDGDDEDVTVKRTVEGDFPGVTKIVRKMSGTMSVEFTVADIPPGHYVEPTSCI